MSSSPFWDLNLRCHHRMACPPQDPMGLETMCTPPNPFDTQAQFARFHHHDVPHMSFDQLERERIQALMCLALPACSDAWFHERLEHLAEAIKHLGNRHETTPPTPERDQEDPKPKGAVQRKRRKSVGRTGPPLLDRDILQRMLSGKDSAYLRALWSGNSQGYRCHQEAQAELRKRLMWCQGDLDQVERLLRQSGLAHPTPDSAAAHPQTPMHTMES